MLNLVSREFDIDDDDDDDSPRGERREWNMFFSSVNCEWGTPTGVPGSVWGSRGKICPDDCEDDDYTLVLMIMIVMMMTTMVIIMMIK